MDRTPLLSCCMIVKNEEQFLRRCLDSVKDYVDEIVIVDTGSQDSTVEIASEYTKKIFFHPWENDFSKHRNQSISYAEGQWILQIDADEEMARGGCEAIRDLIMKVGPDVNFLMVNITDIDQQGRPRATFNFPRVFRNGVGIHYEGIVHNQLVGTGVSVPCPAVIWHYGYYLDEEKMEAKRRRSIPLLMKQLEENPENIFALYNLANMHVGTKDFSKVIDYAQRALALLRKKDIVPNFYISLYSPLIHAYIRQNRISEARKHAEDSVKIFPQYLDGYYLLNEAAFIQEDWEKVLESGEKALILYEQLRQDPAKLGSVVCYYLNSRCHLALRTGGAMLHLQRFEGAEEMLNLGLVDHPSPDGAYRFILKVAGECGAAELYESFLMRALKQYPDDPFFNRLHIKRAIEKKSECSTVLSIFDKLAIIDPGENWEMRKALYLLESGYLSEAESGFSALIDKGLGTAQIYAYRALARELGGHLYGAIEDHEAAIAIDPEFSYSWVKLGECLMGLQQWDCALACFRKAQEAGADGPELLLRMAIVGVKLGDLEISVAPLNRLLVLLGLPNQRILGSLEDLASLFEEIARSLEQKGERRLAAEAFGMASELDPALCPLSLHPSLHYSPQADNAG